MKRVFFSARHSTMTVGILVTVIAFAAGVMSGQQRRDKAQPLTTQDLLEIQQLGAKYAYGLDTGADNGYYVKTAEGWRIKTRRYVQTFPPA